MNQYSHNDQYTYPSLQEVEVQLDILNKTSTQINELERRLEISRDAYRKVLSDQSDKLQKLRKKLGKCISRTRAYNELKQKQAYYRREIQLAALKYDNAISTLDTTRNTLAKLEACVSEPGVRDPNTLESLNQSIIDFNNANKLLNNAKLEHEKLMEIYAANEQSLRYLEKRHCFDIRKAKPYYTMYDRFMVKMEDAKIHVELCTDKLKACKIIYANAMSTLESLSNSIHSMRFNQQQQQQSMMYMTTNHCDVMNSSDHCSIVNNCHHQHPLDEHDADDGVEDVDNCTTTQFTSSLSSVQCTNELTNNENSLLNKSMRDCLNHHHHHHQNNNNNNHNSNVNCFPMMNGLLESIHQASIEIDSLQNSSFLLSQEDSPYSSTSTPSNTTTITTATVSSSSSTSSSLCTENNSCSECLSISSHTSSASISPALSFDAFNAASTTPTTTSLDEHQQHHNSAFMLINSLTNLNLMTTTSTTSSDLYTVTDLCCHSNLTMTNIF